MDATLRERLETDLRSAIRAGDVVTRDALRYVLAAVQNAEIDRRGPLSPSDESAVLNRLAKQLSDAIDQFRTGRRDDLADREAAQLAVLRGYLPAQLDDDELRSLVEQVIAEVGARGPKDMGKVMPALIERVGGRADGRRISTTTREALAARAQASK